MFRTHLHQIPIAKSKFSFECNILLMYAFSPRVSLSWATLLRVWRMCVDGLSNSRGRTLMIKNTTITPSFSLVKSLDPRGCRVKCTKTLTNTASSTSRVAIKSRWLFKHEHTHTLQEHATVILKWSWPQASDQWKIRAKNVFIVMKMWGGQTQSGVLMCC